MTMTPALRKLTLTTHVTASVGWLGALAVFLAHAIASLFSQDEQMVRYVSIAMGLTAWFVILPLSLASLLAGVVQALGTAWGLYRHYRVLFKFLLTAAATGVLLLKLGSIGYLADAASEPAFLSADLVGLRTSILVHSIGGLLVLLAVVTLLGSNLGAATNTPLWVKVFGAIVALLTLMLGSCCSAVVMARAPTCDG